MAEIKAFKGMRFTEKAGDLNMLVCPPYDIISKEQREGYLNANPYNIVRLELPYEDYDGAGKTLNSWLGDGILKCDEHENFYIYEMIFDALGESKSVKGFVTLVGLEEFSKGVILPHEETLSKAKNDRFNLMSATFCNFSQIYSLYTDEGEVFSILEKNSQNSPDLEVTDGDGVIHRMWFLSGESVINTIKGEFVNKNLYIADGHHRYETALKFKGEHPECDSVMMFLVDMENPGLAVFPTHRIVRGLENYDTEELIKKASENFNIKEISSPAATAEKTFILYDGKKYYEFSLKGKLRIEGKSPAYCNLDVSVLHELLLEQCLGIDKENMAKQINLTYTKILNEAIEAVDSGNANCAVLLQSTKVTEIKDVALAGEKMPQKSTYFYPKMITGLVMNNLNND